MARKANGRGKVRAELEGALVALADVDSCIAMVDLRISFAVRRTGLSELLIPAQDELRRMVQDVADARSQVHAAMDRLME